MATHASEQPIFLIKKLGGLILFIIGCLLTAIGFNNGYVGITVLGIALLAGGAALLVLKIVRRNQAT
jgi:uncharacterized membrane protein HdeD (DUF308 family)